MQKRIWNKKKLLWPILLVLPALIMVGGYLVGETYAWLTGQTNADNYLNVPQLEVLVEESEDGSTYDGWTSKAIDWGAPVPKYTRFTNTGESWIVIRASYAQFWTEGTAPSLTYLSNLYDNAGTYEPVATPNWTATGFGNSLYWYPGADGWYYFRYPLAPGDSTFPVLDSVSFTPAASVAYANADYHLEFIVEAVQYSTNPDNQNQAAVWEQFEMTYADSAGTLTWSTDAP